MAYRREKTDSGYDIVIDGFEKGIAPSPIAGIADIRNANLISIPQEASVNFATVGTQQTAISTTFTVTASNDTFTWAGTNLQTGTAVVFSNLSGATGITAGPIYWVITQSNTTFKVYSTVSASSLTPATLIDITVDGSGTFTTVNLGQVTYTANLTAGSVPYFIDSNGRAWGLNSVYTPVFLGNTTLTNANGNGIGVWHGYIFVFRNDKIDYCATTGNVSWTYGWQTLNTGSGTNNPHEALIGQDDELYWTDSNYVGSLIQVAEGTPFDPTTSTTYTLALKALIIPKVDTALSLAYLGDNLLIGGVRNFIYSWNRILTNEYNLILTSENKIVRMVTANTNVFIFAGSRGRIYVTNGSQCDLYAKVPDHLANVPEPYMPWGGAMFNRNQLYFGLTAFHPSTGAVINQYGGVWAIDVSQGYGGNWIDVSTSGTLRHVYILSYGTYAGYMSAIIPAKISTTVAGVTYDQWGFFAGWYDGVSAYGLDNIVFSSTNPYSNYETYVISDAIPVGTLYDKKTYSQVEWKTTVPLASSSEAVRLSYRIDQTTGDSSTFTVIGTTTGSISNTMSGIFPVNFEKVQWVQIKAELKSTSSSPSYVRLYQLRLR